MSADPLNGRPDPTTPGAKDDIRKRLKRTSIPAARKALDAAKADVAKIENIQISPPQLSEVAKRIIGASGKVVEVVRDVSELTSIGKETTALYESLIIVESQRRNKPNQQIAAILYLISCVIFSMRHLTLLPNLSSGTKTSLEQLLQQFKATLEEFGKFADSCYRSPSTLAVFQGSGLKGRLKGFWEELVHHRHELTEFISIDAQFDVHGDRNVEEVNIDAVLEQVGQSPREMEAEQFVADNGGPEAVLQDPALVEQVSRILGENITASLRVALMQDFDSMMKENKRNFDLKIVEAARRIKKAVRASRGNILKHLDSGPHDLIVDPDVKAIWKTNKWRTSVKSRVFMDGVHSHFEPKVRQQVEEAAEDDPHVDEWTLPFLSKAMYSPAVADAIDSDGSGLVSVDECNEFLERRPQGWSVPKWLSYWAVVWLMNNEKYLATIVDTVASIKKAVKNTKPENKEAIKKSEYMAWLDFLDPVILQSLNWGVSQNIPSFLSYSDLCDVQDEYMTIEQADISHKLDYLNYALNDMGTLPSITGNDRIELAAMPLLYLVLKQHLATMERSSVEVLDQRDFDVQRDALNTILFAFNCHLNDLERGWKQMRMDVAAHVECFAGGMFSEWQKKRRNPSKNVRHLLEFWIRNGGDPARHVDENSGWWESIAPQDLLRPRNRGPAPSNFSNFRRDLSTVVFSPSGGATSDTSAEADRIAVVENKLEDLTAVLRSIEQKLEGIQAKLAGPRKLRRRRRRSQRSRGSYSDSSTNGHRGCIIA